jgi:hypothetical protein
MRKPIEPSQQIRGRRPEPIGVADAEAIAVEGLRFLGADAGRLNRFLALSGLEGTELRRAAAAPGFLAGVMDHLMADETLLLSFAADRGLAPALIAQAHQVLLPGKSRG